MVITEMFAGSGGDGGRLRLWGRLWIAWTGVLRRMPTKQTKNLLHMLLTM